MIKYFIYKITSPINRVYIGKTKNLKARLSHYKNPKKIKSQPLLRRSLIKYGYDGHKIEVLEEGYGEESFINSREIFYIEFFNSFHYTNKKGLNLTIGGDGRCTKNLSKPSKKQIEASLKNIKKASQSNRLRNYPKTTKEVRDNLRVKNTGENSPTGKTILNLETGIYYDTIKEASEAHNMNPNTLRSYLTGKSRNKKSHLVYAYEEHNPENTPKNHLGSGSNARGRLIFNTETGIYYDSIREASETYNIGEHALKKYLRGSTTYKTFPFIYAYEQHKFKK